MSCITMRIDRKASVRSFGRNSLQKTGSAESTPLAMGSSGAYEGKDFGREITSASAVTNPTVRGFMHTEIQIGLQIPYKWVEQVRSCTWSVKAGS